MATQDKQKLLEEVKRNVQKAHDNFKDNVDRFNYWVRFLNYSTVTQDDEAKLKQVQKPIIAANMLHAINQRAIYEFAQNPPSITIRHSDTVMPGDDSAASEELMDFLEGYLRDKLTNLESADFMVPAFEDSTEGGFSALKVYTKYPNPECWHQDIVVEKALNPCMVYFDPMARLSHKGDGDYCGEVIFLTKDELDREYSKDEIKRLKANKSTDSFQGFQWDYKVDNTEITAVAIHYYKEYNRERLYLLSTGETVDNKEYSELMKVYENDLDGIEQPPIVVKDEMRETVKIKCVHVCDNAVLREEDTSYIYLPWVFVDGDSKWIESGPAVGYSQVTFPRLYQCYGPQKLLDFCMQTAGNEIENMVMTKFKMPIESLPDDERYLSAYVNPQQASLYMYKSINDKNPEQPLAGPQEVQRAETPSIVMASWQMSLQLIQQCAGTYDFQQQLDARTSGAAIQQGSLAKGMSGEAYYRNMRVALTRVAEIILSLMPIYYDSPRQLPTMSIEGERKYVTINDDKQEKSLSMAFSPQSLKIIMEAGPSIAAQRQQAMEEMTAVASIMPNFVQFLQEKCGDLVISNLDIKERDIMEERWKQWIAESQQSQEQMQQMQVQLDTALKQAKIASDQASANRDNTNAQTQMMTAQSDIQRARNNEIKGIAEMFMKEQQEHHTQQLEAARVALESQRVATEALQAKYEALDNNLSTLLRAREIAAENSRTAVDGVLKASDTLHRQKLDVAKFHHEVAMSHEELKHKIDNEKDDNSSSKNVDNE